MTAVSPDEENEPRGITNRDKVLDLLDDVAPRALCDDCLSVETGIDPRQTVNKIARQLSQDGEIQRFQGICERPENHRFPNRARRVNAAPATTPRVEEDQKDDGPGIVARAEALNIDAVRNEVVYMCQDLWHSYQTDPEPRGISQMILVLRDDRCIPSHEANMILTLCGLRNTRLYGRLQLGPDEKKVAEGAWAIVQRWWARVQPTLG